MTDLNWNAGELEMQEQFDSRRLADLIKSHTGHSIINDNDRAFMERMDMFFLASVDDRGNVDCSYKGGDPGFVRVVDDQTIAFPMYDGNGMFNSSGNIRTNPKVGLLFIERLTRTGLDVVIACTFFGAVTLLMMALLTFLKETRIATALLRIPETYLELHRHI